MAVATPPETASNADVVRWAFDRLNEGDLESFRQASRPETTERFPDRMCRSLDEIVDYFREVQSGVPDWHMDIVALAEQGEDVFVHWKLTGTHAGRVQGIDGTGRRIELDGIDHFVVRDGRIASNFVVFDQMQWAQAVGMLPRTGTPADRIGKAAFNLVTRIRRRLRSQG